MRYLIALTIPVALAVGATAATIRAHGTPARTPGIGSAAPARHPGLPRLETAAAFFLEETRDKIDGNWTAAWRTLYPLHRDVAARAEFVRCERLDPFPLPLKALRVVGVRRSLVPVPGLARPVRGVAVDVHVELRWYGPRDPVDFRHTFHLVPVHGHWAWLLSPSRYRLYRDQGCTPGLAE